MSVRGTQRSVERGGCEVVTVTGIKDSMTAYLNRLKASMTAYLSGLKDSTTAYFNRLKDSTTAYFSGLKKKIDGTLPSEHIHLRQQAEDRVDRGHSQQKTDRAQLANTASKRQTGHSQQIQPAKDR